MPKKRKADVFAAQGSLAGGLRRRREAIESGQLDKASEEYLKGAFGKDEKKKKPIKLK